MKWIPIIILAFIAATLIGIVLITIKVSRKIKFPQNKLNITYTSTSTNEDDEFDSSTNRLKKSIEETGSKYKDLSEQLANFINTLNQDDDEDEDDYDDEDLDLYKFIFK